MTTPILQQPLLHIEHEGTRNRVLRRVDWRFLLPDPAPRKVLCLAPGRLRAAWTVLGVEVTNTLPAAMHDYDLAIATDPGAAELRKVWTALRPDGTFYVEWNKPRLYGPQALQQRLTTAGFTDIRVYWPWPPPMLAPAQWWLPVDAPQALRWFLHHRPHAQTRLRRGIDVVFRAVWRGGVWLGLIAPLCTIARKPLAVGDHDRAKGAVTSTQALSTMDQMHWLLLTGGARSINKVVSLGFVLGKKEPQLVIKRPRVPESIPALRHEATMLRAVHGLRPGGMPGVPQVLFTHETADDIHLGLTPLAGVPLYTNLRRDNYHALAIQATDWLVQLAGNTTPRPQATWWNRLIAPVVRDFATSWASVLDPHLLAVTEQGLQTLPSLPLVCEQRDFSPWNVLVAPSGELVVLDWEGAELHGLPALDLVYFLAYLAFFYAGAMRNGQLRPVYHTLLDPTTFTGRVAADCWTRYAHALGLDPVALHPLRLLCWMLHARSEYRRFTADAGAPPSKALLQRSVFVGLWETEARQYYAASS